jgi:hypothetical protein
MKLKNHELLELRTVLTPSLNSNNLKVAWMAAQNLNRILEHAKLMQSLLKESPAMEIYEAARKRVAERHANKDENGNHMTHSDPQQPGGRAYTIADMDAFRADMKILIEEHPQAQEDRKALVQKEQELLQEDVDFEPYTISVENTKIRSDSDESVFDGRTMLMLLRCGILKE